MVEAAGALAAYRADGQDPPSSALFRWLARRQREPLLPRTTFRWDSVAIARSCLPQNRSILQSIYGRHGITAITSALERSLQQCARHRVSGTSAPISETLRSERNLDGLLQRDPVWGLERESGPDA